MEYKKIHNFTIPKKNRRQIDGLLTKLVKTKETPNYLKLTNNHYERYLN